MLRFFLVLVMLVMPTALGNVTEQGSSIDASFDQLAVDAQVRGPGFLVGVPRAMNDPGEPIRWEITGRSVTVETWTRHYRSVAGVEMQNPDRPDDRRHQSFGMATVSLESHDPNSDLAVVPIQGAGGMDLTVTQPLGDFVATKGYTYVNGNLLAGEKTEPGNSSHPDDFSASSDTLNFEYVSEESKAMIFSQGDFTLTFIYGTFRVLNETGEYRVDARYETHTSTVHPLVHNEHSITRAFVHVTNGTAFIQPGGRPLQVNLAGYDFPAASNVRLLDATGTIAMAGDRVRFRDASLRVVGDGLHVTATPFETGGILLQHGRIEGPIQEVYIDGKQVELGGQTVIVEPEGPPDPWILLFASAAALVASTVAWVARRRRRRRRAGPLAKQARDLLDVEDYEAAASAAKQAVRYDPSHGEAAAVLALACIQLGRPGEAVEHLERSRAEDDPLVRLLLSVSLREAGHPRQARRMLELLMEEHPDLWSMVARTDLARLLNGSVGTSEVPAGYG